MMTHASDRTLLLAALDRTDNRLRQTAARLIATRDLDTQSDLAAQLEVDVIRRDVYRKVLSR
jgi:hypothetical protein